jgi:hypothetical protein
MPVLRGVIERRVLLNYRVDPTVSAGLLPAPFRPQLVGSHAMAGVCLIRLARLRPKVFPFRLGLRFENAAVRMAVEWNEGSTTRSGVFVFARYTSSRLAALAGGRAFPGVHRRARIVASESASRVRVAVNGSDGTTLDVAGEDTDQWPADSAFASAAEATAFFAAGSLGYSWNEWRGVLEGMELCVRDCWAKPLAVHHVASSYFDDQRRFPTGSIALDHALVMRGIEHEWRLCEPLSTHARRSG